MPPEERDPGLLWDSLRQALRIGNSVRGMSQEEYSRDENTRLIVERRLEIMGEIVKRVSNRTTASLSEIPWSGIVGQRNVLAHEYDAIDEDKIWVTVTLSIPELVAVLEAYLANHPPAPDP